MSNIPVNMEQIYTPKQDYKVLVRCFTYNQSKYIEDALNGFAMQKTDFPFVCLVMDDCSTDGEQEVIKAWMEGECDMSRAEHIDHELSNVIVVPHKTNPSCSFAFYLLKKNLYDKPEKRLLITPWRDHCEYEAICEGDDYWIDSLKLHKQVFFMDGHPDYGMIHTDFDLVSGSRNHNLVKEKVDDVYFPSIITEGLFVGTCTTLVRISYQNQCPNYTEQEGWPMGDVPLWIELAYISKLKYLKDVTAKYRILANSASHSNDIYKMIEFKNAGVAIKKFYAELYGVKLDTLYTSYYFECIVRFACRLENKQVAKEYYDKAKREHLLTWKTTLFYIGTKYPIIKKVLELYRKV